MGVITNANLPVFEAPDILEMEGYAAPNCDGGCQKTVYVEGDCACVSGGDQSCPPPRC